jgi:indole-3-glycerol phosphate synthase/phosphoribosylanthranilate isomerase
MGRFRDALAGPGLAGIAEIKRRSPSAGDLRPDADPARLAADFAAVGAAAVSVLVDAGFGGKLDDLRAARAATELPLLGKGFFVRTGELDEIRAVGADCALLLLRDLTDSEAAALMQHAEGIGLDCLVEAHDEAELARAVAMGAPVVGVNARDLSSFSIDRRAQLDLVAQSPRDRVIVAESGISSRAQGAAAELAGADAVLVGSALMQAPEPAEMLAELLSRPLVKVCGLTREEDVAAAVEAGADMLGFVLAPASPRRARAVLPVPDDRLSVAVDVGYPDEMDDLHRNSADLIQVYGPEEGHVRGRDAVLLLRGGEVATVVDRPWQEEDPTQLERARAVEGRLMLAGGLDPENVRSMIDEVHPWAVDASSSLEVSPGIKDHERVRAFVAAAR